MSITILVVPIQDYKNLFKSFYAVFTPAFRYHLAGDRSGDFLSGRVSQVTLFQDLQSHVNFAKLMVLLDRLNHYEKGSVWLLLRMYIHCC